MGTMTLMVARHRLSRRFSVADGCGVTPQAGLAFKQVTILERDRQNHRAPSPEIARYRLATTSPGRRSRAPCRHGLEASCTRLASGWSSSSSCFGCASYHRAARRRSSPTAQGGTWTRCYTMRHIPCYRRIDGAAPLRSRSSSERGWAPPRPGKRPGKPGFDPPLSPDGGD